MSKKSLLLTGATGFVGSNLLPLLVKNFNVFAICREIPRDPLPQVEYLRFDLLREDPENLEWRDFTVLVHLAWGLPHRDYWTDPLNILWYKRSLALVKSFLKHGGVRAHVAGTCAEYDWSDKIPLREYSGRLRPLGLYGKCKNALRVASAALCAKNSATLGWYRIFWPYGPGQDDKKFIPALINALKNGHRGSCDAANLERDYIHITDVARLLAMAINSNFSGILNAGSGNAASLGAIATKIATFLGKKESLTLATRPIDKSNPQTVVADIARQKRIADYYTLFDLDAGIADTIKHIFG